LGLSSREYFGISEPKKTSEVLEMDEFMRLFDKTLLEDSHLLQVLHEAIPLKLVLRSDLL
jgi:hypothetical protein